MTDKIANWRELLPLAREVYASNGAGCCLHIVLDDGNVETPSVEFCLQWAIDHKHPTCEALARLLLRASETQRQKLHDHYDEYARVAPDW